MEEAKVLDLLFFIFLSRALTGNCDPSAQPIMLIEAKGGEKESQWREDTGRREGKMHRKDGIQGDSEVHKQAGRQEEWRRAWSWADDTG